jgi:hypothetical protein
VIRLAVVMIHLLVAGRWLKLLGDDPTERLQNLAALLLGQRRPQLLQTHPRCGIRLRRKKVPSCLARMAALLE